MDTFRAVLAVIALIMLMVVFSEAGRAYEPPESIGVCVSRAQHALDIARDIDAGFLPEVLNAIAEWKNPQTAAWWRELVAEVVQAYAKTTGKDQRAERAAQTVLEHCAYLYGQNRARLRPAASSQGLATPQLAQEHVCRAWSEFAEKAARGAIAGQRPSIPNNLSERARATAQSILDGASTWPRGHVTYGEYIWLECMGRKHQDFV